MGTKIYSDDTFKAFKKKPWILCSVNLYCKNKGEVNFLSENTKTEFAAVNLPQKKYQNKAFGLKISDNRYCFDYKVSSLVIINIERASSGKGNVF